LLQGSQWRGCEQRKEHRVRGGAECVISEGADDFTEEFAAMFCPENEATMALMRLESDQYYQGTQNVEAYIDEFKDLVDLSAYTDPITIVPNSAEG
jgi:hypothetical protein